MKKPFYFAFGAAVYIIVIVLVISTVGSLLQDQEDTIIIPMTMLGLFVLSTAVMGYLFLSVPLELFMENRKQEAVAFFAKIMGIFACFVAVFVILLFVV